MPEIVQEIGAYAGLASVVGLAVLSALYFSQARDVKRLREWAGRAPERAGAPAAPARVAPQPQRPAAAPQPAPQPAASPGGQPRPPGAPAPPVPGAVPAGGPRPAPATPAGQTAPAAAASATGVGPATAQQDKPAAAPAAGQNAGGPAAAAAGAATAPPKPDGDEHGEPASAPAKTETGEGPAAGDAGPDRAAEQLTGPSTERAPAAEPAERVGAPAASAGAPSAAPAAAGAPPAPASPASSAAPASPAARSAASRPAAPGPARPTTPDLGPARSAPPRPGAGGRGPRRPPGGRSAPQQTAILPPRPTEPWYRRLGAGYIALGLVSLVILGGAAAYGVTQLVGGDGGDAGEEQGAPSGREAGGDGQRERRGGGVNPADVTVAVLNGTTVPGLAATLSDEVSAAGFKVGTITNFSDQQLAESVVQYTPGNEPEARSVSRRLGVTQREPVNPSSQALAGDATVIVIAGADKAP